MRRRPRRHQRPRPMRKLLVWGIIILALYLGGRIGLVWNKPNSDSTARVSLTIQQGAGLNEIVDMLESRELVRDGWVFKLYIKKNKLSRSLQAGQFVIQKNLTMAELAEVLQHGKGKEIKITIPEGYTIMQIDELLAKRGLIQEGEFANCTSSCDLGYTVSNLEGYLYPSTYYLDPEAFSAGRFITRLYNTFQQQIAPLRSDILSSGRTLEELIIVASMIEREAFSDDEMADISHVIWKRLDEGIHLGIDATTRYEKNDWKNPLYTEDFQSDSPYNTRRSYGLPPTAISNPSIEAFRAALYPSEHDYYYYLHDRGGQIHFAEDLEGHNRNKSLYLY